MKSILWLASYPKSGNTWLRVFLANYIVNSEKPFPINELHRISIGDSSAKAYDLVAKEKFDINNPMETVRQRPAFLQGIVNNKADINLVKTHNGNSFAFGIELIPAKFTKAAIYIIRNPLDMITSFANHYGLTIDDAITAINHKDHALPGGEENTHQFIGGWSNHVLGWSKSRKFPVLTLRYEDMLDNPYDAFESAVKFIGLPIDEDKLVKAIKFSGFDVLKEQESKTPFREKSVNNDNFFRRGKAGQWKTDLSEEQIKRIVKHHGTVMKKFGYEV